MKVDPRVGLLLLGAAFALPAGSAGRSTGPMTICDLFRNLKSHANKMITLKGVVLASPSYTIGETGCPEAFVTDGFRWPTTVVLEFPAGEAMASPARTSLDKLNRAVLGAPKGAKISVTVTGTLKLKERYRRAQTHYGTLGTGFGHLGASPALLVVKTIDDITVLPRDRVYR